jgi:hypothetical protein
MSRFWPLFWLCLAMAAVIAVAAFAIGQVVPGLGVGFMILASSLWTAFIVVRTARRRPSC